VKAALTLAGPVTSPTTDTMALKAKMQMSHHSTRSDYRLQGRRRAEARSRFSSPGRWNHRRLTARHYLSRPTLGDIPRHWGIRVHMSRGRSRRDAHCGAASCKTAP
jgi:hypothetical protein